MLFKVLIFPIYFFLSFFGSEQVFFKSSSLQKIELTPVDAGFSILDDTGEPVEITAMKDKEGILYWHRRIFTPVCLTGECLMVDVGIYWYCTGEFLGLEVYREHLTRTDHSIFSDEDYDKLIKVLNNDWSSLREYEFTDLVNESEEGVDGTSGATKAEIAEEAVEDAVYTTYTLWHLIHVGEKEQLVQLTTDLLDREGLFEYMIEIEDQRYLKFLMELLSLGRIPSSQKAGLLLIKGLNTTENPSLKKLAIKALAHVDLEEPFIQNEIVKTYPRASIDEKLQILGALKEVKLISVDLTEVLVADLEHQNEWFVIRLLAVLKNVSPSNELILTSVKGLLENENERIKKAAEEFFGAKNL